MLGKARRWGLAGVSLVLIVTVGALIPRMMASSRRAACAKNMQLIVQALFTHGFEPGTNTQDAIQTLVDAGQLSSQQVKCPISGASYCFIVPSASLPLNVEPSAVIAYEPLSNHGGQGACVLYADGHVTFEGPEGFAELLERSREMQRKSLNGL